MWCTEFADGAFLTFETWSPATSVTTVVTWSRELPAKYTPSLAKNMIRRSLRSIIDPHPTDKELDILWMHFQSKCAYCDRVLGVDPKDAHIDHLHAGNGGGANHVSNRVLACAQCNEKEKLGKDWQVFLKTKCESDSIFTERESRILSWTRSFDTQQSKIPDDTMSDIESEIVAAIAAYDLALDRIRAIKQASRNNPMDRSGGSAAS